MIRTIAETVSTNADLIAAAEAGAGEGTWLRAERQSGGRGRLGRAWVSPPGNLYASTIVRPLAGDPSPETLALVAGVALAETARGWAGDGAATLALKWPNDLMAGAAKLAGILLERAGTAVVIGFGVNLAHHPAGLDRPATSLAALAGSAPDPALFAADLAAALTRWVQRWRAEGLAPVRRQWLNGAHAIGTVLLAIGADGPIEGLFEGLDEDGALRLRRRDGAIVRVRAGDVFLVP